MELKEDEYGPEKIEANWIYDHCFTFESRFGDVDS
jgi:hypothetical protein